MSALMDLLSMALLGIGTLFLLIGATGLWRLPDVITRLHGASVTDTLGAGAILLGLALAAAARMRTVQVESGAWPSHRRLRAVSVWIAPRSAAAPKLLYLLGHTVGNPAVSGGMREDGMVLRRYREEVCGDLCLKCHA